MVGRFVPLIAVASSSCVNIPMMRQQEVIQGIDLQTQDGVVVGKSVVAAKSALMQVRARGPIERPRMQA